MSVSRARPSNGAVPPAFSEEALALRFSRQYANDLRYVANWARWFQWNGVRWEQDSTLHIFDLARAVCRAASAECGAKATAMRLASKATRAAVERLAQEDRRHASTTEQWDRNPMLLNTPHGTVDLTTGALRAHCRHDYITKVTLAAPGGDCPLWLKFLERVTDGDSDLQAFLQRMAGYSLSGSTREHALFFFYGTGFNGKSVFLYVISTLLADYAKTAPAATFTVKAHEQHPADLASLRGARLVTAIETEDGARWAESRIKSLTGGDRIATRFMRCDFFEYTPEFKLAIAGNHRPSIKSVDVAIRRRLHLIPFTVTIPEDERDGQLKEKLTPEFPGILAWAIEGCLAWQRDGLRPPNSVRAATEEYMEAEDRLGLWLDECCVVNKRCSTTSGVLFKNYKAWCERTGEREGSQKHFSQALQERKFGCEHKRQGNIFHGIGLREDVPEFGAEETSGEGCEGTNLYPRIDAQDACTGITDVPFTSFTEGKKKLQ